LILTSLPQKGDPVVFDRPGKLWSELAALLASFATIQAGNRLHQILPPKPTNHRERQRELSNTLLQFTEKGIIILTIETPTGGNPPLHPAVPAMFGKADLRERRWAGEVGLAAGK
jgi:hypothetical protein